MGWDLRSNLRAKGHWEEDIHKGNGGEYEWEMRLEEGGFTNVSWEEGVWVAKKARVGWTKEGMLR